MKFNQAFISLLVVLVLTSYRSCDGIKCHVCRHVDDAKDTICLNGGSPGTVKDCPHTDKCVYRRHEFGGLVIIPMLNVERECADKNSTLGCKEYVVPNAGSSTICVCAKDSCNGDIYTSASAPQFLPPLTSAFVGISVGIFAISRF